MTSKELFKNWKNYYINHFPCDKNDINELEQIEKDLKVLNIFRNHLSLEICKKLSVDDTYYIIFKDNDKGIDDFIGIFVNEEEKDLLKEYFKNGK